MARNLIKKGHQLMVSDLDPAAVTSLTAAGAREASLQAIGAECSVIITMLPSSPHVQKVYCGEGGLLDIVKPHTLLIDSSTIDPTVAKEVAAAAKDKGCVMVDAPVSGGVGGAEQGTLTFMVGGDRAAFAASEAILSNMGGTLVHCGEEVGSGQVVKLCNNLVLGMQMVAVSEGMNLGVRKGIDPALLARVFNSSTARCWSSDTYNPCPGVLPNVPANREWEGGFGVDLMRKDLGLALEAARAVDAGTTLGAATKEVYDRVSGEGGGKKDFGYVYKVLADR